MFTQSQFIILAVLAFGTAVGALFGAAILGFVITMAVFFGLALIGSRLG